MKAQPTEMPIVGIPCYWLESDGLLGKKGSALPNSYVRALETAGCAPLLIPVTASEAILEALYSRTDGLLLAGGPDVAPSEYGQRPHPGLRMVTPERDGVERMLLQRILGEDKPLFCICRGIQVLNVACGGTLWQDLAGQVPEARKHDMHPDCPPDHLSHEVTVAEGSRLRSILGSSSISVNTLHHQAIDRLGRGLALSARSPDGVIEAVEGTGTEWRIGVQWHPEWLVERDIYSRRLFEAFAAACREYGRRKSEA